MKNKQGDLAFINKAIRPVNIGRVVTCKSMIGFVEKDATYTWNGEVFSAPISDHIWVVHSTHGIETLYGKSSEATCPDTWLTPIKSDELGLEDEVFDDLELVQDTGLTV